MDMHDIADKAIGALCLSFCSVGSIGARPIKKVPVVLVKYYAG